MCSYHRAARPSASHNQEMIVYAQRPSRISGPVRVHTAQLKFQSLKSTSVSLTLKTLLVEQSMTPFCHVMVYTPFGQHVVD